RGEARSQAGEPAADGDVKTICEERNEDMRFDAALFLVVERSYCEVTLQGFEGFLHFDQLEVVVPEPCRICVGEIGSQEITPFAPAHLPQLAAVEIVGKA